MIRMNPISPDGPSVYRPEDGIDSLNRVPEKGIQIQLTLDDLQTSSIGPAIKPLNTTRLTLMDTSPPERKPVNAIHSDDDEEPTDYWASCEPHP